MSKQTYPYQPDTVTSPGYTLKETIEAKGMNQKELAKRMNRPIKTISEIIHDKTQISPDTAVQLENVLGVPAEFWIKREGRYQEYLTKQKELEKLEEQVSLLDEFPMRDLRKREYVTGTRDKVSQVKQTLKFYGVNNLNHTEDIYFGGIQYQFRKANTYKLNKKHLAAWIREGDLQAEKIDTQPYDRNQFKEALQEIRHLTSKMPSEFEPKTIKLCRDAGVAFVLIPQYQECRTSGMARWVHSKKALIQLSLRYKTDDHFWFSFFHEAAHILKHSKKETFLDEDRNNDDINEIEREANDFATTFMIPSDKYEKLVQKYNLSKREVINFANSMGISPGIVVGRLQHDGKIPYSWMNKLKTKFEWTEE